MLLALSDVRVKSHIAHAYKLLHSGCFHQSHGIPALQTWNMYMGSNIQRTMDTHMQFNSGGLEALLEANGAAMAPSGAVLLTGCLSFQVTVWNDGLLACPFLHNLWVLLKARIP